MTLYRDQITEKWISTGGNFCEQDVSENSPCTSLLSMGHDAMCLFFSLYGTFFRNKEEEGTVNHLWRDMGLSEVRQMFSLSSRRVTFHL